MVQLVLLLTLVTTAVCQVSGMEPDVRFGEDNDRFNVNNIVHMQNQIYRQQMDDLEEEDDDTDMDRRNNDGNKKSHRRHHRHRKLPDAASAYARRAGLMRRDNYRPDENPESDSFQLNRRFINRRNEDKSQQLLNYAVPIHVKIQGYFQAPLDI